MLYFTNLHVYRYKEVAANVPRLMNSEKGQEKLKRLAEVKIKFVTCRLCKEPH